MGNDHKLYKSSTDWYSMVSTRCNKNVVSAAEGKC